MTYQGKYPCPNRTSTNALYLDAWLNGELVLQRCNACGHTPSFPREFCPSCFSNELRWSSRSGIASIVEFTVIYSHVTEPFASEGPVIFAELELSEGGRLFSRIINEHSHPLLPGAAVRLVPLPAAARFALPTFTTF